MPGFDGTGPAGMGPMTGGGRGFCIVGEGMPGGRYYGVPRRMWFGYPRYMPDSFVPGYVPQMSRAKDIDILKRQAEALKNELNSIETRIRDLGKEKK